MLTDEIPLLDQHCHGVCTTDLDRRGVESMMTEAAAPHRSPFDSMLGVAMRRWCAPELGLAGHAEPDAYLACRARLGWEEVTRRMLRASGTKTWLLDTGLTSPSTTGVSEFASLAAAEGREVVRLETVAEDVAASGVSVAGLADAIETQIRSRSANAAGLKTVAAYRSGLEVYPRPPSSVRVRSAMSAWKQAGSRRLTDPALLTWLLHTGARIGAELGLPLQIHTGFGDPDEHLSRADPLLLTEFLRSTQDSGLVVMLLHCWPYHRNASYLAHVFPHVLMDLGLTIPHVGARSADVLAEALEVAPFGAVCFSSDGYGLPELHYLGARLWRQYCGRLVDQWLADDVLTARDAERLIAGNAGGNAAQVYGIEWP